MARIRTIKPEFWSSEPVMECSITARLLFIGLWNFCDDHGRHPYKPRQLKCLIFPGDDISSESIHGMLTELAMNGLITVYESSRRTYLQVNGWDDNQVINRRGNPRFPAPGGDDSVSPHGVFTEDSLPEKEKEKEKEKDKKKYRFSGRTIRLDDSLYEAWHRNYPDLDLDAQLQSLDDWVSQQSGAVKANWIFAVSGALKNRQEVARAKKKPKFVGPQFKPEKEFVPEPPEVREARVEAWKNRGKHALVRGDDEGQEGTISELAPKEARVSDLLPALQAMDYAQED